MIKIKGTYMVNGDIFNYSDYADTIEEAVRVIDYRFWFNYKILLRFYYNDKLLRRLSDDCSFEGLPRTLVTSVMS